MGELIGNLIVGALFILFLYRWIKTDKEKEGVYHYDVSSLKYYARVSKVETNKAGDKYKRYFRVVVSFDDGFEYKKLISPSTSRRTLNMIQHSLSNYDQSRVIQEAQRLHNEICVKNGIVPQNTSEIVRENLAKDEQNVNSMAIDHIQFLSNNSLDALQSTTVYMHCAKLYYGDHMNYEEVVERLPQKFPQLSDKEMVKRIAAYMFFYCSNNNKEINVFSPEGVEMLDGMINELDILTEARKNGDSNSANYDERVGIYPDMPMYFTNVHNAHTYVRELLDKNGNPLTFNTRFSYSFKDDSRIFDGYIMLDTNGNEYGKIYASIYGRDNYTFVPKGYKHLVYKNPDIIESSQETDIKEKEETTTEAVEKTDKVEEMVSEATKNSNFQEKTIRESYSDAENSISMGDAAFERKSKSKIEKLISFNDFEKKLIDDYFNKNTTDEDIQPSTAEDHNVKMGIPSENDDGNRPADKNAMNTSSNEKAVKFCRYCGAKLAKYAVYCHKCGKKNC